jgi:Na+-driven multidrug efflux pump
MNTILRGFSVEALNVFGLYFKLQSFIFMPIFGLNNGMIPIVSYNFGAQRKDRVFATVKLATVTAIAYMFLGLSVFHAIPDVLLGFFDASEMMLVIGRKALRIISLSFIFAGFSVISIATCQALGKSIYSLIVSVGRQLVVLIPTAFLLSLSGNVDVVWFAFPIAELMSLILCAYFLIRVLKKSFPK